MQAAEAAAQAKQQELEAEAQTKLAEAQAAAERAAKTAAEVADRAQSDALAAQEKALEEAARKEREELKQKMEGARPILTRSSCLPCLAVFAALSQQPGCCHTKPDRPRLWCLSWFRRAGSIGSGAQRGDRSVAGAIA